MKLIEWKERGHSSPMTEDLSGQTENCLGTGLAVNG